MHSAESIYGLKCKTMRQARIKRCIGDGIYTSWFPYLAQLEFKRQQTLIITLQCCPVQNLMMNIFI